MKITNAGSPKSFLLDAPVGRHFCQLHRTPESLAHAVSVFAETGLRRGDAVILVAAPRRIEIVLQRLGRLDVDAWRKSGQLSIFDSAQTLNLFMRAGVPDWGDFLAAVRKILDATQASPWKSTRVFGEMVNDLWRAGNTAAAIRLEEYWNRLANEYSFSLFCGYEIDHLDGTTYEESLAEIARTHSDMLSTAEDERFSVALNAACRELLGSTLTERMTSASCGTVGERQLDIGRQMVLWLKRHMPDMSDRILDRARYHYGG